MSKYDNEIRIMPSVLDRLIDEEPDRAFETLPSRSKSIEDLKQSVKRDLEWLLNTRRDAAGVPSGVKELNYSLAMYGLPDFTSFSIKSPADQGRMQRILETAISSFEPRLENVVVTMVPVRDVEQKLRFRIDARLKIEPAPEPVTFDTVLQTVSNQYTVRAE
jgi:type VI secretion system protein ImpF